MDRDCAGLSGTVRVAARAFRLAVLLGGAAPATAAAQPGKAVDLQNVFDAGHNLGALAGDIRWEWAHTGAPAGLGLTAGLYPTWVRQAMAEWNEGSWTGVPYTPITLGLVEGFPTGIDEATRVIRGELSRLRCEAIDPSDVAGYLFDAAYFLARDYYETRREPSASIMRPYYWQARQAVQYATRALPALAAINLPDVLPGQSPGLAVLGAALSGANDIIPDGFIPCDGGAPPPPPPPLRSPCAPSRGTPKPPDGWG